MSTLAELALAFRRNVILAGAGFWAGEGLAHAAGIPAAPADLAGIAIGAAAAIAWACPVSREVILRKIAGRPRRVMTPEDYARLAELERELGFEPDAEPAAEPPASRKIDDATARALSAAFRKAKYRQAARTRADAAQAHEAHLAYLKAAMARSILAVPPASIGPAPAGPSWCTCPAGTRAPVSIYAGNATAGWSVCGACGRRISSVTTAVEPAVSPAEHFTALKRVGRWCCASYCPICAGRRPGVGSWGTVDQLWLNQGRWEDSGDS